MPHSICTPPGDNHGASSGSSSAKEQIAAVVQDYLANLHRPNQFCERRRDERIAFPTVIQLTPVDPENLRPLAEPILVVGKQISASGLGFFHTNPLPHRCYLVSMHLGCAGGATCKSRLVFRAKWCRFVGKDLYECGGQFIKIVAICSDPDSTAETFGQAACQPRHAN